MTFSIKQNDTAPTLRTVLLDSDGNPINLTGSTVSFVLKSMNNGIVINSSMTVVTPLAGLVEYDWQTGDTDTTGTYYAEFRVTYSDLSVETFPNSSNATVIIYPSLV